LEEKLETVAEAQSRRASQASINSVLEEDSQKLSLSRQPTLREQTRSRLMLSVQLAAKATESVDNPALDMESVTSNKNQQEESAEYMRLSDLSPTTEQSLIDLLGESE
jgi:hypothetical protein